MDHADRGLLERWSRSVDEWYRAYRDFRKARTTEGSTGQLVLTWQFRNAFPAVYRVSPLDAASSEVVLETVELAFDTMDVEAQ